MEHTEKLKNSKEVISYLAEKFPACFILSGEIKPLKIGIFQDLATALATDPKVSKTLLRTALRQYTTSWRYLHSVKLDQPRIDLEGKAVEIVTQEHADHAKQTLKESKDKAFANKPKPEGEQANKAPRTPRPTKAKAVQSKPAAPVAEKAAPVAKVAATPAPAVAVTSLTQLKLEQEVKVKLGSSPISATVKEITKDDVQVQLTTGMMMRVKVSSLVI